MEYVKDKDVVDQSSIVTVTGHDHLLNVIDVNDMMDNERYRCYKKIVNRQHSEDCNY